MTNQVIQEFTHILQTNAVDMVFETQGENLTYESGAFMLGYALCKFADTLEQLQLSKKQLAILEDYWVYHK